MPGSQQTATVALALVSGLVGGSLSSQLLTGTPVFAEKTSRETTIIRAEKFEVVDKDGRVHGELGLRSDGTPVLRLYDEDGNPRVGFSPKGDEGSMWSAR
jgi:hypothetical protein